MFFCGSKGVGERNILAAEERRGVVDVPLSPFFCEIECVSRPARACPDVPVQGYVAVVDMQEGE